MSTVHLPLIFDFKQPISGNGFLAGVKISGARALMVQEDDQWWMYGVFPSTLSEYGKTPNECFLRYMEGLKAVLFDFAEQATSFEAFEKEVTDFCSQASADEPLWTAAQKKLRAAKGEVKTEDEFIQKLPAHRPEDRKQFVEVVRLDVPVQASPQTKKPVFSAKDNTPAEPLAKAA